MNIYRKTQLAQLVERTPFKRVAVGSSPTSGDSDETTIKVRPEYVFKLFTCTDVRVV